MQGDGHIYAKSKASREITKARDGENGEEGVNPETTRRRRRKGRRKRTRPGFWRAGPRE